MVDLFAPSDQSVHPSAGCGSGAGTPGSQTLTTGGQEGTYLVSLPPSYNPNSPSALGFVFHGANNTEVSCFGGGNCSGVQMALADKSIVIYPRSFGSSWTNETREQNVQWFDDLLAYVKANYCVDEHEVFVMGTSSGAHFSNILGCRRGDELRAIAPGDGERLEKTGCKGEFAALVIHGIDDTSVPFALGEEARNYYAMANGCSNETVPPLAEMHAQVRALRDAGVAATPRNTAGIFRCVDYQGCREGLPVRWCEDGFDNSTHGYPLEGGATTWDFVSKL
jgi:poly(3-hydroxybutyrate) depolymerase